MVSVSEQDALDYSSIPFQKTSQERPLDPDTAGDVKTTRRNSSRNLHKPAVNGTVEGEMVNC